MKTSALLITTTTHGYGPARMPQSLFEAGFEVSLLAPANALAEKSRFIARVGHLPDAATPRQWIYAFAATVKACAPRLVVPGDDNAMRLMQMLVLAPPPEMQPAIQAELAALVRDSLGEPAGYESSSDKLLLPAAANALGVPVAPHAQVGNAAAAETAGPLVSYPAAAWKGELLSGYAAEKLVVHPEPEGPSTVSRYHRSPALRAMAGTLAKGLGITGFFSLECAIDRSGGTPYLLGINRRIAANTHRGSAFNVDPCKALLVALHGLPSATRADFDEGEEHIGVHFPQEWLRDPGSRWLRDYPVDLPWEEPELIEAMIALRRG